MILWCARSIKVKQPSPVKCAKPQTIAEMRRYELRKRKAVESKLNALTLRTADKCNNCNKARNSCNDKHQEEPVLKREQAEELQKWCYIQGTLDNCADLGDNKCILLTHAPERRVPLDAFRPPPIHVPREQRISNHVDLNDTVKR